MSNLSIGRLLLTIIGSLVVLATTIVVVLVVVFNLRVELSGGNTRPIFSFGTVDNHFELLEHNRSQHRSRLLPAPGSNTEDAVAPTSTTAEAADSQELSLTNDIRANSKQLVSSHELVLPPSTAYWTDFRGPSRDGHYQQMEILTEWPPDGLQPLWTQPIGGGYASFVSASGSLFTIEQRRDQEVVAAYDVSTGRELWTHAWEASFQETMGGPGPRATPTWHAGHVYALGATGKLWCLDAATGNVIWHRDILHDGQATNLTWAMSASPLVVDDLVVVQPGGPAGWSVVAYDRRTSEVVWHVLDDVQGYASPMTATLSGVRQILVVTADRAVGLEVNTGRLLWEHPWSMSNGPPTMAQPLIIGGERVFLSAGYGHGATVIEVSSDGDRFIVEELWRNNRMKNRFSSSVLHEGYIYGLDESILACVNAATGELQWKGGRYGHGQLLLANGHLVVLTERGDLVLVRATPEAHEEVATSEAIEGKTWNVPALADGRLVVRNTRQMAAFDLRIP